MWKLFNPRSLVRSQNPTPPQNPATLTPIRPKSISELEREMAAAAQPIHAHPVQKIKPAIAPPRILSKLSWMAILLGVPIAALWVVNLPYPPLRRAVSQTAPVLLLSSYISMDRNFREAIVLVEQARQLIVVLLRLWAVAALESWLVSGNKVQNFSSSNLRSN